MFRKTTFILLGILGIIYCESTSESMKLCRYRDHELLYPPDIFVWIAGEGCYIYTAKDQIDFWYSISYLDLTQDGVMYKIPYSTHNGTPFVFDYLNEEYLTYIRPSFKTEAFFNKWVECAMEAADCCENFMNDENIFPTQEHPCPAVWDAWTCYRPASAGTIAREECSSQAYSSNAGVCITSSEKECFENGTWNVTTNYGPCAMAPLYRIRHGFHVTILYISMALALPAVIIFCSFRKLRIMRVIHHRNLLIIIIVRNILTIMSKSLVILDALKTDPETNNVMKNNDVPCRVLAFFESASKNGIYAFMLADGFYLHKMIVRIFAKDPNIYIIYLLVGVSSFTPTIVWATLKAINADESCWMVDEDGYQWYLDGFRIAVLAINTLLLLDIIRVLVLKLRKSSTVNHTKSTLRATLFLIPLFGLHIIFVANRGIVGNTCTEEDAYYFASYTMEGLQGILVAVCFCYLNSEVHREIANAFRKLKLNIQQKFHMNDPPSHNNRRRTTAATYVRNSLGPINHPKNFVDLPEPEQQSSKNVEEWLANNNVGSESEI